MPNNSAMGDPWWHKMFTAEELSNSDGVPPVIMEIIAQGRLLGENAETIRRRIDAYHFEEEWEKKIKPKYSQEVSDWCDDDETFCVIVCNAKTHFNEVCRCIKCSGNTPIDRAYNFCPWCGRKMFLFDDLKRKKKNFGQQEEARLLPLQSLDLMCYQRIWLCLALKCLT